MSINIAYLIRDEAGETFEFEAQDDASARVTAVKWIASGEYSEIEKSLCVSATLYVETTPDLADYSPVCGDQNWAEVGSVEHTFHPREPKCTSGEHDYKAPHKIVGGLPENPGVWSSGGVKTLEVCMHCGCSKLTNTRADDGRGGQMESVSYVAGELADEVAALHADEVDLFRTAPGEKFRGPEGDYVSRGVGPAGYRTHWRADDPDAPSRLPICHWDGHEWSDTGLVT
jgi:hypothetical protein